VVRPQAQQPQQAPQTFQRRGPGQPRGSEASAETTETFERTARLVPGATFELRNMTGGSVTIIGGDGRELRLVAVKRVRNAGSRAQAVLDAIRVDVAERGGNVEVQTRQPRVNAGRTNQPNRLIAVVDYEVILPSNANVVLRTGSGNVRMQNVIGDAFDLVTVSGDVIMQELRGRLLDLHTVMGNMVLQDINAERALVQSTAGNVEYMGRFMPTGRYKFLTHNGNIRMLPRDTAGFDLDATTYRGALRSDYELKVLPQAPNRAPQRPRTLRATVGDASAAVTAQTFGGNIVIVKP
jgi:DUF4097 and DUF4098 domain-containing protein YvlB